MTRKKRRNHSPKFKARGSKNTETIVLSNYLSAFIWHDHAYRASPDLRPGDFIHGHRFNFCSCFSVEKRTNLPPPRYWRPQAPIMKSTGRKSRPGSGQQILLTRRVLRVAPFLQQSLLGQRRQPSGQDRRGDAQAFPELVEAREAGMGVPQDQYAPRVASESQAARDRAGVIANIFVVHTVLIVTYFQIDSIVDFNSIVTP
jgi:hypothetical protein